MTQDNRTFAAVIGTSNPEAGDYFGGIVGFVEQNRGTNNDEIAGNHRILHRAWHRLRATFQLFAIGKNERAAGDGNANLSRT
jgi:hypothetical protein